MVALYADEQFPIRASKHLRTLGYDVLTVQEAGNANKKIPDREVIKFATEQSRAVITINRRDFIRLHHQQPAHAGIIVTKDDPDRVKLAERIHRAIQAEVPLANKLIRVKKSAA